LGNLSLNSNNPAIFLLSIKGKLSSYDINGYSRRIQSSTQMGDGFEVAMLMLISGVSNICLGKLLKWLGPSYMSDVQGLIVADALACVACSFLVNFQLDDPTMKAMGIAG